jgi:signal transduction histidine kinase
VARLQFGGAQNWVFSGLETLVFISAGALLHLGSTRLNILTINLKYVLWIATVKTVIGLLSIYSIHLAWPETVSESILLVFFINRLMMFPIFFGMLYGLLLLLKIDAQQQHYQSLQLKQMAARLQTALQREHQLLGISHNLKTPLTRLRLRQELMDEGPLKEAFEADVIALDDMVHCALETLRSPDGQEKAQPTRLDLLVSQLAGEPIYLNARINTKLNPITLTLQPKSMQRAIGNLMDNGILYGHRLTVHLQQDNKVAVLTIRDFGPGIAESNIAKVFQPHVRLNYAEQVNAKGTGLGLSISRNVIRAHGGDIKLRNHPEGGLEVQVTLPLKYSPEPLPSMSGLPQQRPFVFTSP